MPGEMVKSSSNEATMAGYLSIPTARQGPREVVIQERWGLAPPIKSVTDRFAGAGFLALAPDLYHGKATESPDEAGKFMMAMNIDKTEQDLAGAVSHLKSHPH